MGNGLSNFEQGDSVIIGIKDMDVIRQMQTNHGEWNDNMKECMDRPCTIMQGLGTDVLIRAQSGGIYRINPELLIKYGPSDSEVGNNVVVMDKEEEVKQLQVGHGGWSDSMKDLLGKTVEIVQILPNGDYKVKFGDRTWTMNSACFVGDKSDIPTNMSVGDKVKFIGNKTTVINLQENHGGWTELMSLLLGEEVEIVEILEDGDCYVSRLGMNWMVNRKCFENKQKKDDKKDTEKVKLKKGDTVQICDDLKRCEQLQQYHGGWVSAMKGFVGKVGTVQMVLPTGDIKVNINGLSLVYNSKLLTKIGGASQQSKPSKSKISIGDKVKVLKDKSKVKFLQKNHGEWIDTMRLILGEKGKVKGIYPDGDLRVKIMGNTITLNPECVTKIDSSSDSDSDVPDVMKMMKQVAKMMGQAGSDSDKEDDNDSDRDAPSVLNADQMKLFVAVKAGDYEQTKTLLSTVGPNISKKKICPLIVAVNEGHERIVELLLEKGANIDTKDSDGDTALHLAVQRNRPDVCRVLIRSGANVNLKNNTKITPLMLAAVTGVQEILRMLVVANGVDLNIGDNDKDTALHLAIQKSRLDSVEILLEAGADIFALNEKQFSAFHMSVLRGHEKILEAFLMKAGPSIVDLQKEDKFAAIHLAAINNHTGCIKLLVQYKADLNIRNNKLQTALHLAVSQKYLDCVKILVENKADLNLKDEGGDTPIHDAVRGHNMEKMKQMGSLFGMSSMLQMMGKMQGGSDKPEDIVIYLAKHGAKLDIKNNAGKTPIDACDDDLLKAKLMSIKDGTEPPVPKPAPPVAGGNSAEATREIEELRRQIQRLEDENICIICADRRIDCTFECGHMSCETCANNLYECHMCRQPIDHKIKMFR